MLNKIIKYGTAIGIGLSLMVYTLLTIFPNNEYLDPLHDKLYKAALAFSVLFILTISTFINQKFDILLKVIGLIMLVIIGINALSEFNLVQIDNMNLIIFILFSSLYILYFDFFLKKQPKTFLSYFKILFASMIVVNGLFVQLDYDLVMFESIIRKTFWTLISVQLMIEYIKPKQEFAG